ncbi:2276_t:CDS:2 [Funneliformis caledonium]|uniref:2276_t:CDS:1 n=1 Tax=Funneliformis caledonium TaxID=1117310 RepID=A0A9N8YW79_9GLOM|nr:2276_t:CDS:2 [Funneliformis caledonium]
MIFCFVVGNNVDTSFEVTEDEKTTVLRFKEIIFGKNQKCFGDIDANKLRLWRVDIPWKNVIPDESDEGRNKLMIISSERLGRITRFVENSKISILRSPPSSEKSALRQYLREYFNNHNYDNIYISLASINGTQTLNDESLFESKVKQLMSNSGNQNLKILFFSTYHPILSDQLTPVQFKYAFSLNNLFLNREELQQLAANYVQHHIILGSLLFNITEDIQEAIFNFTGGHPEKILQYLASSELRNGITSSTRAFHWILDWILSNEEIKFIHFVLLISHSRPLSVDYDSNPVARRQPAITFEEFLEKSIHCMSLSKLSESLERGKLSSPLYERS